jgi:hypothetical protein
MNTVMTCIRLRKSTIATSGDRQCRGWCELQRFRDLAGLLRYLTVRLVTKCGASLTCEFAVSDPICEFSEARQLTSNDMDDARERHFRDRKKDCRGGTQTYLFVMEGQRKCNTSRSCCRLS